jgi:hypothetical protein
MNFVDMYKKIAEIDRAAPMYERVVGDEPTPPGINRLTGKPIEPQSAPTAQTDTPAVVPLNKRFDPRFKNGPEPYTIDIDGVVYKFAGRDKSAPGGGEVIKVPAAVIGIRGLGAVSVELGKDGMYYPAPASNEAAEPVVEQPLDEVAQLRKDLGLDNPHTWLTRGQIAVFLIPGIGTAIALGINLGIDAVDTAMYWNEGDKEMAGLSVLFSLLPFVGEIPGVQQFSKSIIKSTKDKLIKVAQGIKNISFTPQEIKLANFMKTNAQQITNVGSRKITLNLSKNIKAPKLLSVIKEELLSFCYVDEDEIDSYIESFINQTSNFAGNAALAYYADNQKSKAKERKENF